MGIVKVIVNGVTKMDITPTTLDASEANKGEVFFNRSGVQAVGTGDPPSTRVPVIGMGKNLLDNGYLLNPVNQRGQSSYTASGYTVDRWLNQRNDTVSLESNGVRLTYASNATYHQLAQIVTDVERFYGKTVTFSAILETTASCYLRIYLGNGGDIYSSEIPANSSGLFSVTTQVPSTTTAMIVFITSGSSGAATGSFTIKAAKLELGAEQTLAHEESGVWVLNEIPDYGEELRKCQKYLWAMNFGNTYYMLALGFAGDTTRGDFILYAPADMYKGVTPSFIGSVPRVYRITGDSNANASAVSDVAVFGNIVKLSVTMGSSTRGEGLRMLNTLNSTFGISCEPTV